jgi:3-oxoacyl-[acyl-carrier-protein] synthase-3
LGASVEIAGIACKVPDRVVTNVELESLVDTSDEWIKKRTGIRRRHISTGERSVDMALEAASKALANSGVDRNDIGLIITSSITSEYVTPSMSGYVQKALDIDDCANMDISAGCSGFVYALSTAASLMESMEKDAALVISSEAISQYVDWKDRSTCVLFGDGAGAVVIKRSNEPKVHFPVLSGSPDMEDVIICKREIRKTPFNNIDPKDEQPDHLRMNGREVFTYAVSAADAVLRKLLAKCGDRPFTKVIPHQANAKIIDYVKRKLRFKSDQFFLNIDEYANTSSATIPIAMCDAYKKGWLTKGDRVALVAFGSGLTCGGLVVDWTI